MPRRREFLQQSAAALAAAAFSSEAAGQPGEGWYDRPMRWAQLTLVEDDPGNYDPQFWLDYFSRTHSDAACLSARAAASRIIRPRFRCTIAASFSANRDSFGELVAGCRKLGMNVIARTDPHAVHQDVYDAHPDWIAVDAEGRKRKHWADPELWVTCALGPYNFEFMTEVTQEIVRALPGGRHLQQSLERLGHVLLRALPKQLQEVLRARPAAHDEPAGSGAAAVHRLAPAAAVRAVATVGRRDQEDQSRRRSYIANAGGGALSDLDMKTIGELAPTLFADRQARRGVMPPWANGKNGKEYRATMGSKAIGGIFSVGVEEPYRWKDSVQNGDEIRLWVVDGMAHDLRPWFTKFNGKVLRSALAAGGRGPLRLALPQRDVSAQRAIRWRAWPWSIRSRPRTYYGGEQAHAKVEDHALGFYQALVEARIPFDMVHDRLLDAEHLSRYRTLILPNIAALSTEQCRQLTDFVRGGGNLVATHETSLYDEWGVRRSDFGLASLFGASFAGRVDTDVHNSYLNVDKDPQTGSFHPLVRGLEDAEPHHQRRRTGFTHAPSHAGHARR